MSKARTQHMKNELGVFVLPESKEAVPSKTTIKYMIF